MTTKAELDYWVRRLPSTAPAMQKHYRALEEAKRVVREEPVPEKKTPAEKAADERAAMGKFSRRPNWPSLKILKAPVIETVQRVIGTSGTGDGPFYPRMVMAYFLVTRLGMYQAAVSRALKYDPHSVEAACLKVPAEWPGIVQDIDRILIG